MPVEMGCSLLMFRSQGQSQGQTVGLNQSSVCKISYDFFISIDIKKSKAMNQGQTINITPSRYDSK